MTVASHKFIRDKNYSPYSPKLSVTLEMTGCFGIFISFIVLFLIIRIGLKMNEQTLLWIVISVIVYSAFLMFTGCLKVFDQNKKNKYEKLSVKYQNE